MDETKQAELRHVIHSGDELQVGPDVASLGPHQVTEENAFQDTTCLQTLFTVNHTKDLNKPLQLGIKLWPVTHP